MTELVTIDAICKAIQGVVGELDGIRKAPDYPVNQMNFYPFAVTFPGEGIGKLTAAGFVTMVHSIITEIHIARHDMARDVEAAIPYLERFIKALLDDPLVGSVVTAGGIIEEIEYSFGLLGYFDQKTIGWQFTIPFKSQGNTS